MTDYSNVSAVCLDCAQKAGFVQKNKIVGAWIGECEICHQQKPCIVTCGTIGCRRKQKARLSDECAPEIRR